jgi:hypothetical protein
MKAALPPLLPVPEIQTRLLEIFPDGTPNRGYCTRDIAAKTVFVMLYVGAVENRCWLRPDQVTRMTDAQSLLTDDASRLTWTKQSLSKKGNNIAGRWYAVNSREPIRDETLREGLVRTGAAIIRTDLPTTSAAPRYALTQPFTALFDPRLQGGVLKEAITKWQSEPLRGRTRPYSTGREGRHREHGWSDGDVSKR